MREIKFRGKTGTGNWVYGDLTFSRYGNPYIGSLSKKWSGVKRNTVGQYTCMNDSTGKEIYEGDIVRTSDNDDELAVVEWDEEDLRFTVTHGNVVNGLGEEYYPREVEVVGNIYDDPELLGGDASD